MDCATVYRSGPTPLGYPGTPVQYPDVRHYPIQLLPRQPAASCIGAPRVAQRLADRTCVNVWDMRARLCVRYV